MNVINDDNDDFNDNMTVNYSAKLPVLSIIYLFVILNFFFILFIHLFILYFHLCNHLSIYPIFYANDQSV